MSPQDTSIDDGRRTFVKTLCIGAVAGGLAAGRSRPVAAQSGDGGESVDLTDWFADVDNFDGVVDETGSDEVTVEVGVSGNGGAFGFGPAAVRVDPGTTVVWEWTGEGVPHNVAAEDGSYESEYLSEAGATFDHVFESEGVSRYVCTPHAGMGMKAAVIVGDVEVDVPSGGQSGSDGGADGGSGSGDGADGGSGSGDGADGASGGDGGVDPDYGDWFENVDNFDGTVDATGQDKVRIEVGAEGENGPFAFEPAAVHVDPGTTVVWEWTGEGGQHDVYSDDPAFASPMQSEAGETYALEVDGAGVVKYACTPHEAVGMKGAVVVGDPAAASGVGIDVLETGLWGLAAAIVAAPFVASEIVARRRRSDEEEGSGGRPPAQPAD